MLSVFIPKLANGFGIETVQALPSDVSTMPVVENPVDYLPPMGGAPAEIYSQKPQVIDMVKTLDGSNQEVFSPSQPLFDAFDQRLTQAQNVQRDIAATASYAGGPTAVIIESGSQINLPVLALAAVGVYFFFWRKK
jgi:hypothetical protein